MTISEWDQRLLDQGEAPRGYEPTEAPPRATSTFLEARRGTQDTMTCPDGAPSFPEHEWQKLMFGGCDSFVQCARCKLVAVDRDEDGIISLENWREQSDE